MTVICTDTNALLGGVPIPPGTYEIPFSGSLGIFPSAGTVTNFNIGPGDVLMVWPQGAALYSGVDPWNMFLIGLFIVWGGLGLIAFARRIARHLTDGAVKEV